MTQSLARALGPANVNVNALAPGRMATEAGLLGDETGQSFGGVIASQAIKRRGEPTDMAGTAVFLASDDSDFICGQVIIVDGGSIIL